MPLFRCLNCGREIEAAKPACADCGIDPAAHPRDRDAIVPLLATHFDPPGRRAGVGAGHAACDPKLKTGRPGMMFTGEPVAVNCPKCKLTEAFLAANGASDGAIPMTVGPKRAGG